MTYGANATEYLVELLRCALTQERPPEKPAEVSWQELYAMARKHSVAALTYHALSQTEQKMDEPLGSFWKNTYEKALVKNTNQMHELKRLCQMLDSRNICHMPLKGSILRELYPIPELREMTDLDILVPQNAMELLDGLMTAEGYHMEPAGDYHVEYLKKPHMVVELHTGVVSKTSAQHGYYADVWSRTKPCNDSSVRRCFCPEDEYIFLIVHAGKHYNYFGTGIRTVMDVFVFLNHYGDALDRGYIDGEIAKLHLTGFMQGLEGLARWWFRGERDGLTPMSEEIAYYVTSGSTYGSRHLYDVAVLRRNMERGGSIHVARVRMLLHMAFLPREEMANMYPVLKKRHWLLPLCWLHRWLRILLRKPASVFRRVRQVHGLTVYQSEKNEIHRAEK